MIEKQSSTLKRHKQELQELLLNTPVYKRTKVREHINIIDHSQRAEMSVENLLKKHFSEDGDVHVIHDLCLAVEENKQILVNHVVIDGLSENIWVLRTIGRQGEIEREENGEWRVHYPKTSRRMVSPQDEVVRHGQAVAAILMSHGITNAKIKPIVLMGPRVRFGMDGEDDMVPVINCHHFISAFKQARKIDGASFPIARAVNITTILLGAHRQALPSEWYKKLHLGRNPTQPRRTLRQYLSDLFTPTEA